jgi:hypothetical protein
MWKWLRVGKRIERVLLLLCIFSFLVFAIPAILYRDKYAGDRLSLVVLIACIAGLALTLYVPALAFVRAQRRKQGPMTVESHAAPHHATALSRGRVYALMTAVTLMSAIYQAYRLDEAERPLGHSKASVFLWNSGILLLVVGLMEVLRRRNQKQ